LTVSTVYITVTTTVYSSNLNFIPNSHIPNASYCDLSHSSQESLQNAIKMPARPDTQPYELLKNVTEPQRGGQIILFKDATRRVASAHLFPIQTIYKSGRFSRVPPFGGVVLGLVIIWQRLPEFPG
jgi:hypothetical protein